MKTKNFQDTIHISRLARLLLPIRGVVGSNPDCYNEWASQFPAEW
jgi:hypothetical protein